MARASSSGEEVGSGWGDGEKGAPFSRGSVERKLRVGWEFIRTSMGRASAPAPRPPPPHPPSPHPCRAPTPPSKSSSFTLTPSSSSSSSCSSSCLPFFRFIDHPNQGQIHEEEEEEEEEEKQQPRISASTRPREQRMVERMRRGAARGGRSRRCRSQTIRSIAMTITQTEGGREGRERVRVGGKERIVRRKGAREGGNEKGVRAGGARRAKWL